MAAAVLVLVVVASRIDLGYYALTPGQAQPVGPLVKVPPARAHPIHGPVLLTDVYESRVTLLSYLPDRLNGDAQLVPATAVLGSDTPPDELTAQGYLEMAQAQASAKAAAFRRLSYRVPARQDGTLVMGVAAGSPASPALRVGQIVRAVDGVATPGVCAFERALEPHGPGDVVKLSVERSTVTDRAVIEPGPTVVERVRLGRTPPSQRDQAASGCPGVASPSRGHLGVEVTTNVAYRYPFPVGIDTSQIGGPSAGLAMTLTIIDKLYGGDVTGGRTVAATGTIDPLGYVGPVGGVPQKTVAVERAGATAFLVPPAEYRTAEAKAVPSLHVYPVATLAQALSVLHRLGGEVPPRPSAAGAAGPAAPAAAAGPG
ncbi:MAG: S16 family serine protease [Acidimicrobiales bacterium]